MTIPQEDIDQILVHKSRWVGKMQPDQVLIPISAELAMDPVMEDTIIESVRKMLRDLRKGE